MVSSSEAERKRERFSEFQKVFLSSTFKSHPISHPHPFPPSRLLSPLSTLLTLSPLPPLSYTLQTMSSPSESTSPSSPSAPAGGPPVNTPAAAPTAATIANSAHPDAEGALDEPEGLTLRALVSSKEAGKLTNFTSSSHYAGWAY